MLLAEELALVAVDPETGHYGMGTRSHLNASLAGLLVAELMLEGLVARGRRKGEIVVVGGSRCAATPVLALASEVVSGRGPKIKPVLSHMDRGLESRMGYGTWEAAVVGLAEEGIVGPVSSGMRPRTELLDPRPRDTVVARLQAAARSDDPMEPRTALLLNMTGPASLLEIVAPERRGRRHARHRIDHALDDTAFEDVGKMVRRVLADAAAGAGAATIGGGAVASSS